MRYLDCPALLDIARYALTFSVTARMQHRRSFSNRINRTNFSLRLFSIIRRVQSPLPLLFSNVVRFRVKFESMHRIRTNGWMDGRMDGRPHRSLLLSRTYSINSYDREVFYLSDTRAIDLSRAMEIIFIFLFFFFFFLLFLFFSFVS